MNLWHEYLRPTNLSQAIKAFAETAGPILPIAAGTDLLLDLEQGRHSPVHTLLDVTSIEEMTALEVQGDELFVGAAIPVNRIVLDPLVIEHARALTEACNLIAGPQVRNVATLCGNVAHALPAADGTVALMALDAEAAVARQTSDGAETLDRIPLAALFQGPGKSAIDSTRELVTAIRFRPLGEREASAFARVMRPQGVALPILGMAA